MTTELEKHARQLNCRNIISKNNRQAKMCWSCGHKANIIEGKCECCNCMVRKHEDKELLALDQHIKDCIAGSKEPEYRLYTVRNIYWVKKSLIDDYLRLKSSDKFEKYHFFIKKHKDSGIGLTTLPRF